LFHAFVVLALCKTASLITREEYSNVLPTLFWLFVFLLVLNVIYLCSIIPARDASQLAAEETKGTGKTTIIDCPQRESNGEEPASDLAAENATEQEVDTEEGLPFDSGHWVKIFWIGNNLFWAGAMSIVLMTIPPTEVWDLGFWLGILFMFLNSVFDLAATAPYYVPRG